MDDTGWVYTKVTHSYKRSVGNCTAHLWKNKSAMWDFVVQRGSLKFSGYNYASLEDALAWCDAQIALGCEAAR